jgi:hypothetical protein
MGIAAYQREEGARPMKKVRRTDPVAACAWLAVVSALVACGEGPDSDADESISPDSAAGGEGGGVQSPDGGEVVDAGVHEGGGQDGHAESGIPVEAGPEAAVEAGPDPVEPDTGLRVGLWISPWDLHRRTSAQWVRGIKGLSYASSQPNQAIVVFGLCGAADTTTFCQFPKPASIPDYPNIEYGGDVVTPILDAIEADGTIDVILDVEPMNAHVSDLMHVVMTRYGSYSSVVGFSPDWEWVTGDGDKQSKLPAWKDELHGYRPGMEMHLISWMSDSFGSYRDPSLSYGYDGQMLPDMDAQIADFTAWTNHFAPNRTAWYWGYNTDASWTRPHCSTPEGLRDLLDRYRDINPDATILMAVEQLYFEIEGMLPEAPMWP